MKILKAEEVRAITCKARERNISRVIHNAADKGLTTVLVAKYNISEATIKKLRFFNYSIIEYTIKGEDTSTMWKISWSAPK